MTLVVIFPRKLTKDEIVEFAAKYGHSGRRAKMAGFDAVRNKFSKLVITTGS